MRNLLITIVLVAGCDVVAEGYRGKDFADGGEMTEDQDLEETLDLTDREEAYTPAVDDLSWGDPCLFAYGTLGCPCAHDCCLDDLACDVQADVCYDPVDPDRLAD